MTPRTEIADLIVIGAGPAGANAALAAHNAGLKVVLVDEAAQPGGQVWRAPITAKAKQSPVKDIDRKMGDALRQQLVSANIHILTDTQVWSADRQPEGFEVGTIGEAGTVFLRAPRLIAAPGAYERILPFPGWTIPGVFGLAAATALLKAEKTLPGRRIIVAGQGPLLIAVAAQAVALGLRPVAIVDAASRADWAKSLAGYARQPRQLARGMRWMAQLTRARVPYYRQHEVSSATGADSLAGVTLRSLKSGETRTIDVDTLFVGNGLTPADEVFRLLGADQEPCPISGTQRVVCDELGRCSVPGLYAAGDAAGIRGALPALHQGRIAGLAAAHDAGALSGAALSAALASSSRALTQLQPFADASCRLMRLSGQRVAAAPDDTIICRCEDVRAGDIRKAINQGAVDINQLKHFTRLGMGPCQGRICAVNAAEIIRQETGAAVNSTRLTPRGPIRPLETAQLIGEFGYSDIPIPKPAPL
ncbi:FAD-dependent oxidoreductase [Pseudoruegeria sp. SK021]|uniref:FAD-dependent oxidoreductase n=1 Tax=Pseudoruegeria sp. SK021 TaxID=1933035 RepID=UPI000A23E3F7|nr:FAD-dependent oxidoreductase [Pseudoruegeria sp. SK021]OSP54000.1 hypothetical protein BV911_14810 [Pseudoruegeria sp. SK021]